MIRKIKSSIQNKLYNKCIQKYSDEIRLQTDPYLIWINETESKRACDSSLSAEVVCIEDCGQDFKIDNNEYCVSCYKEELSNTHLEISYLRNNTFTKKILSPVAYLYLILKSNPKEISLNIKLYKALKDSKCFDIGFYLNKNKDLINSTWCKYFSPELHYVCNGFNEDRVFNKKNFNRNSKKELLDYLLTCDE